MVIFIVRQLRDKYLEKKEKLYHIFLDLEKLLIRYLPPPAIKGALGSRDVPESWLIWFMALYRDIRSMIRVALGNMHLNVLRLGLEFIRGQD